MPHSCVVYGLKDSFYSRLVCHAIKVKVVTSIDSSDIH